MSKPTKSTGVMEYPSGYGKQEYRCKKCCGELSALTLRPGVEVCRRCAILYAVHEINLGSIYHIRYIKWPKVGNGIWYESAEIAWHPKSHPCTYCDKEKEDNEKSVGGDIDGRQ